MLRKIRISLALIFFLSITLLFLDFTGTIHAWLGWMAKIQLLPAILAANLAVILGLFVITLLFGRVYCSVICPLGVMQDVFAYFGKRKKKNRYSYSAEKRWLRYGVFGLFIIAVIFGLGSFVALLAPYSSYGRIVQNILSPVWIGCYDVLGYLRSRFSSYSFYPAEIWIKSIGTFAFAAIILLALGYLSWRNGRTYCNTICPVGTILSFVSQFSIFRPVIDKSKCVNCKLCSRNCKSSCIDIANHRIDYSRCVSCMDCIAKCPKSAIQYTYRMRKSEETMTTGTVRIDSARRNFLVTTGIMTTATAVKAQKRKLDNFLPTVKNEIDLDRIMPIVPPGAVSLEHMARHCTGCQLCVSLCKGKVLRPSGNILTLMQPEMSYEHGFCQLDCNICSQVCPSGAILPLSVEKKSSTRIGHAELVRRNCIPANGGEYCDACAKVCPSGAIRLVPINGDMPDSPRIPQIDAYRCIGCGACEYSCPAKPIKAIYVEGHIKQTLIQ